MDKKNVRITVKEVRPVSPHTKALYETGKALMASSLEASREFCKFMIGTSISAIPIYLGALAFILPEKYRLGVAAGWTVTIPAFGFLIASLIFTFGYMPIHQEISLDDIHQFATQRDKILSYRKWSIWVGLFFFIASTIWAIISISINIGVR